mgnify:CR=1 FL=1
MLTEPDLRAMVEINEALEKVGDDEEDCGRSDDYRVGRSCDG